MYNTNCVKPDNKFKNSYGLKFLWAVDESNINRCSGFILAHTNIQTLTLWVVPHSITWIPSFVIRERIWELSTNDLPHSNSPHKQFKKLCWNNLKSETMLYLHLYSHAVPSIWDSVDKLLLDMSFIYGHTMVHTHQQNLMHIAKNTFI